MFKKMTSAAIALVAGSVLLLSASTQAKAYKAAEIVANNQLHHYGRYVMRMKAARGSGLVSTFFTYKDGSEQQPAAWWEEIDIEIFGKNNATCWQSNSIVGHGPQRTEGVHCSPFSLADDYHTYQLEWTPTYLAWSFDGKQVRRIDAPSQFVTGLQNNQDIRFNIWPANVAGWVGPWNDNILPVYQIVNWFEYYSYEGGNNFKLQWREDFNNLSGWHANSHSFGENMADFTPANAVTKDGYLILAITKEGQEGVPVGYHPQVDGLCVAPCCPPTGCVVNDPVFPRIDIPATGGTLQAEAFQRSVDGTVGNQGGALRKQTDTDIEATTDVNGGFSVGWIDANEWLEYDINVKQAGNFTVDIRVAALTAGGKFNLVVDGNTVGAPVTVSATGGYQVWQTLKANSLGYMALGNHTVRIQVTVGGFNLNALDLRGSVVVTPDIKIPGVVQAEDFARFADNTPGNTGGAYKNTNVDIEATTDLGGGFNVGWIDTGEWLEYDVNVTEPAQYVAEVRVAAGQAGGMFTLELDGKAVNGTQTLDNSGGWQVWKTVKVNVGNLVIGNHVLRLQVQNGGFNINYINFTKFVPDTTAVNVPGKVEAEKAIRFMDATLGNTGNSGLKSDLDTETTSDVDGGLNVGWIDSGEWLEFDLNSTEAATLIAEVRVASGQGGGSFSLLLDGKVVGGVQTVNNTGGWQNWQSISVNVGNVVMGKHVLRVQVQNGGFNLNWINVRK